MAAKNKLLTVLSEAEQYALYGLPDFDDAQRLEYLGLTETEMAFAVGRPGSHAQVDCAAGCLHHSRRYPMAAGIDQSL